MRLFQNSGLYPAYLTRLERLAAGASTFKQRIDVFLDDRFGAAHFLQPVLDRSPSAFFTNGDDKRLQRLWARENGMSGGAALDAILLAQIEHHRTEVFYNLDPLRYGSEFVRRLPGCVRKALAWRAAPSPGADFGAYDLILCNFAGILADYQQRGWRGEYFTPAHDPEMDQYALNKDRPIDVAFAGGYSRHHRSRALLLEAVASMSREIRIQFHLDNSRLTRLAESPLGRALPLGKHRRPAVLRSIALAPVFGRELYSAFSRAKIVLNGAIDMTGSDRGNMRCFEAMGCGSVLLSDEGKYPVGMANGATMVTWRTPADACHRIRELLSDPDRQAAIASAGRDLVERRYSKTIQWREFERLSS